MDLMFIRQLVRDTDQSSFSDTFITELITGVKGELTFNSGNTASKFYAWDRVNGDRDIYLELYDPMAASVEIGSRVNELADGYHIKVTLATNAGSAITSTAANVVAELEDNTNADRLCTYSYDSDGSGTVTAHPATRLMAGRDPMRDPYRVAEHLWTIKAGDYITYVDVNLDGQKLSRSQHYEHCMGMATHMRKLAPGRTVPLRIE